jgi:hypothetical protein
MNEESIFKLNLALRRLNTGNACYLSVRDALASRLISEKVKITVYKTAILPVVLYRCET